MFKNNKYASPKVAMQQRDGLAILAFFLKSNPDAYPNPAFQRIAQNLVNVQMPHQQVALAGGISIKNLVPALKEGIQNLRRFVYKGSLPTPPCYESVTWVIFRRPINLVPERFTQLRGLYRGGGQPLCGNTRPIQKLNNKEVFYFEPPPPTTVPPTTVLPTTVARSTTAPKSTTKRPSTTMGGTTLGGPTTAAGGASPTTGAGSSPAAPAEGPPSPPP